MQKSLKDSGVADVAKDRKIRISTQGTREPRFRLDPKKAGERDFVLPGNKEYVPGDQIKKPQQGEGGRGKDAATSGDGAVLPALPCFCSRASRSVGQRGRKTEMTLCVTGF